MACPSPAGGIPIATIRDMGDIFRQLAIDAGRAILAIYDQKIEVRQKADMSPVSDADEASERIILAGLQDRFVDIPIVSEEAVSRGVVPDAAGVFILVDPLDGTREFLAHNGEFTVNIALIQGGEPVLGVVYAPVAGTLWSGGIGAGGERFCEKSTVAHSPTTLRTNAVPLRVRPLPDAGIVALASRSHLDGKTRKFIENLASAKDLQIGSSLKFCVIAEGEADVYPRFAPTMEWDTAAGDAVLRAAGGGVLTPDGKPLAYGKPDYRNTEFIAWGDVAASRKISMP